MKSLELSWLMHYYPANSHPTALYFTSGTALIHRSIEDYLSTIGLSWSCISLDKLRSRMAHNSSLNGSSLFSYFASSIATTGTKVSADLPLLYLTLQFGLILGRGTGTHCRGRKEGPDQLAPQPRTSNTSFPEFQISRG